MRVAGTVISQETSPFNSPPDSPGRAVPTAADDEPPPPELPARPKPRARLDSTGKPRLDLAGFEPPPVHHSVAVKRRERDQVANGAPGSINPIPQRPGLDCRGLPSSPPGPIELARQAPSLDARKPATRPPRPAPQTAPLHPRPDATSTPQPSSLAVRREGLAPTRRQPPPSSDEVASTGPDVAPAMPETISQTAVFPDGTRTNRRPPVIKKGCTEILTRYEPRILDVCGEIICTSGQLTRVWNIIDGEQIMSLSHTEGSRATSAAFKPAISADEEGAILWLGTNLGDIIEVELATQRILLSRGGVHARFEVSRIHRCRGELWTLDEGGTLLVWSPDADGSLNLAGQPSQTLKLPRGHTFSMVVERTLWHAAGKSIRIFAPTADGNNASFQVLVRPLTADGAGDISSGAQIRSQPGKVFLGHVDGKISIFSTTNYSCLAVLSINSWKINALAGVGQYLWAGYNSGKMCVYDTSQSPWRLKKEWQAHEQSILKMRADAASSFRLDRLQVVSLGADGKVKAWDGLLQEDWLEEEMKSKDEDYCGFEEIRALVMTWNAGATTPNSLRYSDGDAGFFRDLVQSSGWPEMFVFGFQELVDLEDKTATAKRFLKSKKKEGTDQERMSHQYRDWRDFLQQTLDDYMPAGDLYHLLHSAPLVGLFTCVFVKSSLRERIRGLSVAEVKRGMGGLHGNKGAVAVRFQVDETSVCFVNCHLAAGQSQANSRHNDIAAILEAGVFPAERDPEVRMDSFTGGGDGAMILDHEICVLNGDLNYRIDTMSRDTVVKAIRQQQLPKLLERDQLLVAWRRNPTFRLRVFDEMPITFAPTYKYDVGSDNYDTSEKKRSPAWCDRLLFRGQGRVQQLDYRRHEVRVSDHRPVTGHFRLWVKKVDPRGRAVAWMKSQQGFEDLRQRETAEEKCVGPLFDSFLSSFALPSCCYLFGLPRYPEMPGSDVWVKEEMG